MRLLALAVRQLWRNRYHHLALLAGLVLAAALLAGLPAYANVIAAGNLQETLRSHAAPVLRNFSISASAEVGLDEAIYRTIQDRIGDVVTERIAVRDIKLPNYQPPRQRGELRSPERFQFQHLWAFQDLEQKVRVVEGGFPAYQEPGRSRDALYPPVVEAAIGAEAAERTGLHLGDVVTTTSSAGPVALRIVGILEPLEPRHTLWWDDPRTFSIHIKLVGRSTEIVTLSLLVPEQTLERWFPQHNLTWRILVDSNRITIGNAQRIEEALANLQTQLRNAQATLESGLPQILADFRGEFTTARMVLFLSSAPAFVFILYTLGLAAAALRERMAPEWATLVGRGASGAQVVGVLALEGLVLALLAGGLLGPGLVSGMVMLAGAAAGSAAASRLPVESWILALAGAGLGWLVIVLPAGLSIRRTAPEPPHWLARPVQPPWWQRLYLDLALLLFGGAAYWQIRQSDGVVMGQIGTIRMADPLLLLGSAMLLVAAALVFLRIFPYLLRLAAWITRERRGLPLSLELNRLARWPFGAGRAVLLVSLAAALALFTSTLVSSLGVSQEETAHYRAAADLRISSVQTTAAAVVADVANLPGVLAVSPVVRAPVRGSDGGEVNLLAIDPPSFARIARYPTGPDSPPLAQWVQALAGEALPGTLPAIVSRTLLSSRDTIGGRMAFALGGTSLEFEIRAIADSFPTLPDAFVVTDLGALGRQVDLSAWYFSREAWCATDPARHAALASDPRMAGRILGDAQAELRRLQADAMAQGISGAFQLNTLILAVLSVAGFLLAHYLTARQRTREFGLLRTMGLSSGQLWTLLVAEGSLVVGLGLLAGTIIGYGLTWLMLPYFSRALASSPTGTALYRIVTDWGTVLRAYAVLLGGYALGTMILLLALLRTGLHRALRLGEE